MKRIILALAAVTLIASSCSGLQVLVSAYGGSPGQVYDLKVQTHPHSEDLPWPAITVHDMEVHWTNGGSSYGHTEMCITVWEWLDSDPEGTLRLAGQDCGTDLVGDSIPTVLTSSTWESAIVVATAEVHYRNAWGNWTSHLCDMQEAVNEPSSVCREIAIH